MSESVATLNEIPNPQERLNFIIWCNKRGVILAEDRLAHWTVPTKFTRDERREFKVGVGVLARDLSPPYYTLDTGRLGLIKKM